MRTTINLNEKVLRALKLRSAETDTSVSQLIEEAVTHQILEDLEDMEDAQKRQSESVLSFDDLVADFKSEGLI